MITTPFAAIVRRGGSLARLFPGVAWMLRNSRLAWLLVTGIVGFATGDVAIAQAKKKAPAPQAVAGWGEAHNVDRSTKVTSADGKLTITVPGVPRNLNLVISDLSAPRVLQEVTGDFLFHVKVSGDFHPSPVSTVAPRGKAYNGAGPLLWVSERLFIRLERNIWMNSPTSADCHPPLWELVVDGVPRGTSPAPVPADFFSTPATWFRLERRGNNVSGALSHDNVTWTAVGTIATDLPETVQIGVAAVNTSRKPFTAEFEELRLEQSN
jgi:regulation of enolase protein 1 (concanavalin A-like superfamily)